jgi:hypothetical protein
MASAGMALAMAATRSSRSRLWGSSSAGEAGVDSWFIAMVGLPGAGVLRFMPAMGSLIGGPSDAT